MSQTDNDLLDFIKSNNVKKEINEICKDLSEIVGSRFNLLKASLGEETMRVIAGSLAIYAGSFILDNSKNPEESVDKFCNMIKLIVSNGLSSQ